MKKSVCFRGRARRDSLPIVPFPEYSIRQQGASSYLRELELGVLGVVTKSRSLSHDAIDKHSHLKLFLTRLRSPCELDRDTA